MTASHLETTLLYLIRANLLPEGEDGYRFHLHRRWKFDRAWVDHKLAVEVEGGTYAGGRHTRGKGYENDCRKYNQAVLDGWRLLRFTADMIEDGTAIQTIKEALGYETL